MRLGIFIALFMAFASASWAEDPDVSASPVGTSAREEQQPAYNTVVLQGLNKVTAHVSMLEAPLGVTMRFGNLEIIARSCWQSPPEESPENAALLEIRELKAGEGAKHLFTGWMFSSSPAISALEHPVYDITVIACARRKDMPQ